MNSSKQFSAILAMNAKSLTQRGGLALTIVIGMACAIGVLVSMLAMGFGARNQAMGNVRPDRVILTSSGAQSTSQSSIPKEVANIIRDTPGIRMSASGHPIAVFEALVMIEARKRMTGTRINFPVFGVISGLEELRPELRVTAGRLFQPGLREIIASEACDRQYTGFEIGAARSIRGSDWIIVGHFKVGPEGGSCNLYADAGSVMSAFDRTSYNQVTVMLESPAGFEAFRSAILANPTVHVEAKFEREAVAEASKQFTKVLNFVSYFVGAIMAIGATLGAVNSLYAIVDSRRRESATLQAIGFDSGPIVAATIAESILLALPGALLGIGLAWIFFNGMSVSPMGMSFQLAVTPPLAALGVAWALVMGLFSGLPPALRAARVPITTALRAT